MFEEQAFEITAQVVSTFGVEKEERLATSIGHELQFRHPWLQLNLLTAFVAARWWPSSRTRVDRL